MPATKTDPKPAEAEKACDLCNTLWPADALTNGVCPDCLDEEE
jgi:RNA polymerase subunit RPABC4/transcription elongation factor Spt4